MTTTEQGRRYKIRHVLGQGGFGTVYAAELMGEGGFTRQVALKVLNPDMDGVEDVAHRLRDEARLLGLLRHRAVVHVDGLVKLNDRWTVVMELIEGADLQRIVRGAGPMPLGCALEVVSEVASVLDVAYMTPGPNGVPLHILHRDIKPPNILLTSAAETKVLDFGIARAEFTEREAKTKSVLFGSIGYMAPERMEFTELPAGDVFALGVVLYELLDGSPLGKTSINPVKHAGHVDASVARLLKKLGTFPPEFPELLKSMLSYDPEDRPTAREVERRCRQLRGQIGDPWLRDWAEKVIPPLLTKKAELQSDAFSGQVVVEGGSARLVEPVAAIPPAPERPPPPPPPPIEIVEPPQRRGRGPQHEIARPRRQGSVLGTVVRMTLAFGCGFVILMGAVTAVAGVGTFGAAILGFLAVAGLAAEPTYNVQPPADPYIAADPTGDGGSVIPSSDDDEYRGPFGYVASVTEPWKSVGFPLGRGACIYSDDSTFTAYHPPNMSVKDRAGQYRDALIGDGWTKNSDYAYEETFTASFSKGSRSLTLAVMPYQDDVLVSISSY